MYIGQVGWFDHKKGYGFISSDDFDEEIFVNLSYIRMEGYSSLSEGQQVSFSVNDTMTGPHAKKVWPAEDISEQDILRLTEELAAIRVKLDSSKTDSSIEK